MCLHNLSFAKIKIKWVSPGGHFQWNFAQESYTQGISNLHWVSVRDEPWVNQSLRVWSKAAAEKKLLHHFNHEYSDGPEGRALKNPPKCPGEKKKVVPSCRLREHLAFHRRNCQGSNTPPSYLCISSNHTSPRSRTLKGSETVASGSMEKEVSWRQTDNKAKSQKATCLQSSPSSEEKGNLNFEWKYKGWHCNYQVKIVFGELQWPKNSVLPKSE